ncbi:alcohol dehydrogenase catalytic domain-containing protein [uncultured Psychroserpens sp.]|uniref:alcohol dehydrogenase catalytic domain-containing protein n=1 Tax=uncultured Psychroserpens sp. TaxID=255436 RepID=UPI0026191DD1|nr:alcohol dehydrogenase catalytic domain-containing protein [uncultured Psychroserpens sp.]
MKNKYLVVDEVQKLRWIDSELEKLQESYVRIKFNYCGICGSDVNLFMGRKDTGLPMSIGHEFTAEVIELGDNVTDLVLGDIVTSDINFRCGSCLNCIEGNSHLCESNKKSLFSNRGLAMYADFHKDYLYKIGNIKPLFRGALVEPLACVIHALNKTTPKENDQVLVNGVGSIGTLFVFALQTLFPLLKISIRDINSKKIESIKNIYNDNINIYNEGEMQEEYSVIYEASSSPDGLRKACNLLKKNGRLSIMSHLDGYMNVNYITHILSRKDVEVQFPYLTGSKLNINKSINIIEEFWTDNMDEEFLKIMNISEIEDILKNKKNYNFNKLIITLQ